MLKCKLFVDPEHKFDLAIQLGDLETGYSLATESASEQKWKQLAELATRQAKFDLAQQCLHEAQVRYTNNFLEVNGHVLLILHNLNVTVNSISVI